MRLRRAIVLAAALAAAVAPLSPGHAAGARDLARDRRARLATGVVHEHLTAADPDLSVNVARISPEAQAELRTVSAADAVDGAHLERPSAMCARVGCIAAINGDFFRGNAPVGAVVSGGEMIRSPARSHRQLMVGRDGAVRAGALDWYGSIVTTDLDRLRLRAVNRERGRNGLVLYTRAFGNRTATNRHGAELSLRFVTPRGGRLLLGQTVLVRARSFASGIGNARIPAVGAVLSGNGKAARALRALWRAMQAGDAGREMLLRVETTPEVTTAIGGVPVLVRDGRRVVEDDGGSFVRSRHPRTIVGWNDAGEILLVAIDGRQPGYSAGATLVQAANVMIELGATDALNLDGGGSTTFVVGGDVVNRPSDRLLPSARGSRIVQSVGAGVHARNVERPVANALVVVPAGAARAPKLPARLPAVPRTVVLAEPPHEADPASVLGGFRPAIVGAPRPLAPGGGLPVGLAGLANLAAMISLAAVVGRRALREHLAR
ncbi:MAG TPA: phosphodiester glycosidase family protein [Actinomycetota bacterium]